MKTLFYTTLFTFFTNLIIAQVGMNALRLSGSYLVMGDISKSNDFTGGNLGFESYIAKHATLGINAGYYKGKIVPNSGQLESTLFSISPEFRYYFGDLFESFYLGLALPSYNTIKTRSIATFNNELVGFSALGGVGFIENEKYYAGLSLSYARLSGLHSVAEKPVNQFSASIVLGYKWKKLPPMAAN